ncbi:MAG: GC-type dockerin domain-anchored protein [Planctomycetota bacterium]
MSRTAKMTCLTALAAAAAAGSAQSVALPFTDDFESGNLESERWPIVSGVTVNANGLNEPSPSLSMNPKGFGRITSAPIAANVLATLGQVVTVSFWAQHRGTENGESLLVEYTRSDGTFATLTTLPSDGNDEDAFTFVQVALPLDGYNSDLRIRFESLANQFNDNWYIDNIRVGAFGGTNPPFTDDFEDGFANLTDWSVVFNADTPSAIDPNPPSGTTTARLNRDDFIETVPFFLGVEPNVNQQQYVRFWLRADGVEAGESLLIEYNAPDPANPGEFEFKLLEEIVSTGFAPTCFRLFQFPIPMSDYSDEFRLRFAAVSDEFNDQWLIDDVTIANTTVAEDPTCVLADIAAPCGLLDLADTDAFIQAFVVSGPDADLVPPFGIVDLDDVDAFINAFLAGCTQPYGEPGF